jgi:hypothetical protein
MLRMKRSLIVALALFAGAAPAAVLAAKTSKARSTTTTKAKTTTTTTTSTSTTTRPPTTIGGTVVLGATKTPVVPPVCPTSSCQIVLTRATALETIRDSVAYPTKVRYAGTIVAFTVGLAKIPAVAGKTPHQVIAGLDATYGGVTMAGITVLKPATGKNPTHFYTVVASSPMFHLQPYLGYDVEFPLATQIPVLPGEVIALTVPTWAPVLTYNLAPKQYAYRQSRTANCANAGAYQNAQLTIGQGHQYKCDYAGTRVEYNATEITTPPVPKNYVH